MLVFILRILIDLSFVLLLLCCTMWFRSGGTLFEYRTKDNAVAFTQCHGVCQYENVSFQGTPLESRGWIFNTHEINCSFLPSYIDEASLNWAIDDFGVFRGTSVPPPNFVRWTDRFFCVRLPTWFIAILLCIAPLTRFGIFLRHIRRLRHCRANRLCVRCYYSLDQLTGNQCPECGTKIATHSTQ